MNDLWVTGLAIQTLLIKFSTLLVTGSLPWAYLVKVLSTLSRSPPGSRFIQILYKLKRLNFSSVIPSLGSRLSSSIACIIPKIRSRQPSGHVLSLQFGSSGISDRAIFFKSDFASSSSWILMASSSSSKIFSLGKALPSKPYQTFP